MQAAQKSEHNKSSDAGIAQLVEHDLAKVGVASSNLVSRSIFYDFNSNNRSVLLLAYVQQAYTDTPESA